MAEVVNMPRLSDTMEEGTVAKWHKQIGDKVEEGDLLAEIETDKATMEFEAFQEGVLLHIGVEEGNTAPVDSILAILGEEGEDISALLNGGGSAPAPKEEKESAPEEVPSASAAEEKSEAPAANGDRLKASPLAKKLAEDKGIDINQVKGSGEGGRIVKRDIDNFKAPSSVPAAAPQVNMGSAGAAPAGMAYDELPVSQMRKTIARRLSESKFSAPHFYLTLDIDMDQAIEARKSINAVAETKISFNDFVIKAAAVALKQHPVINSSWDGDVIRRNHDINIGMAVAVDEGLLVPVIRHADQKGLATINKEAKEFAGKARDKKLQPQEWEGNTFTISNLGMFGIEEFTAIINSPDACILAVGGIKQVPVVKNGEVVPGNVMKVTLSCDHRVVDGASGAAFLQTFKGILESPLNMLL
ncbi:pyruvate dehydrogenase complex dihydrolipoamide acetyltransferase [Croceimicrobium sp.]|uniref:pyruvate dehydrogenase complex dihydrolipoamide acetyltransferase n=1 Tax=Croceimicrobium sp. TaxID=2828340 RepID=UPI003BACD27A